MLVVLLIAAAAIIAGVAVVAVGRGGELTRFGADVRPVDADIETAADVALLRPSAALWGYDKRSTDEALNAVAQSVTERDVQIAALLQQIADMRGGAAAGTAGYPGPAEAPGQTWLQGQSDVLASGDWSAWKRKAVPRPEDPGEDEAD